MDRNAGQSTRRMYSGWMQWCLRRILDIRWHDSVRNANIRRITNQPSLSSIVKSCRLIFFGHLARMDENSDQMLAKTSSNLLQRTGPPGRPHTTWMKNIHDDLSSLDLGIHERWDACFRRHLKTVLFAQQRRHNSV